MRALDSPIETSSSRHVRRLCVRASSPDHIGRTAILVEDALRTASLPMAGQGRLVVIRHLELGRINANTTGPALSLQIERVARSVVSSAVAAESSAAVHAEAVVFRDRAEAIVLLARRLARRSPAHEWYWSLAVPGWSLQRTRSESWVLLLDMAHAQPAAALTVVAILREVLQACREDELISSVPAGRGSVWLEAAGWSSSAGPVSRTAALWMTPKTAQWMRTQAARWREKDDRSLWLASMLAVAEHPSRAADPTLPQRVKAWLGEVRCQKPGPAHRRRHQSQPDVLPLDPEPAPLASNALSPPTLVAGPNGTNANSAVLAGAAMKSSFLSEALPDRQARPRHGGVAGALDALRESAISDLPLDTANRSETSDPLESPEPTEFAGLLFLVPALTRLGFPDFLHAHPHLIETEFGRRLICFVGKRVGLPADDPVTRSLGPVTEPDQEGISYQMPEPVQNLLRNPAPRGRTDSPFEAWLTALRRWCRRHAGIGLHSLIRRPGQVAASRTHIDVLFDLNCVDLRVRRAGLDLDPGWAPWLGRVVLFHYIEADTGSREN